MLSQMDTPASKPQFSFVPHPELRLVVCADGEATASSISLDCKHAPQPPITTLAQLRSSLVLQLFHAALNCRLQKMAVSMDPPFLSASTSSSTLVETYATHSLQVNAHDGQLLQALRAALDQLLTVRRDGFSEHELAMCVADIESRCKTQLNEAEQQPSASYADMCCECFLRGEVLMSTPDEVPGAAVGAQ